MKELRTLNSGAMVCALVAGYKTQTRRIAKPLRKNRPSLLDGLTAAEFKRIDEAKQ
jgi:hypothetical protein